MGHMHTEHWVLELEQVQKQGPRQALEQGLVRTRPWANLGFWEIQTEVRSMAEELLVSWGPVVHNMHMALICRKQFPGGRRWVARSRQAAWLVRERPRGSLRDTQGCQQ